jgi:hypothetical protein
VVEQHGAGDGAEHLGATFDLAAATLSLGVTKRRVA